MTAEKTKNRVLVLGIGGAGANTVRELKKLPEAAWMHTALIDTDSSVLEGHPADIRLGASSDWLLKGTGCGGDVLRGERAVARERNKISSILQGYDLVLVTGGLGGGTATGGINTIASLLRSIGIPGVFLLTTPFSFEPFARRKNAEDCLRELFPVLDILLVTPNDLLFSTLPPSTPAAEAFSMAAKESARTLAGIASVMRCRDLIGSDYAVFMATLREHRCVCGAGVGIAPVAAGADRTAIAVQCMLESPFLGGRSFLKKADAILLTVSGGGNMTLAEMKRSLEHASAALPPDAETIFGFNTYPENPDFFQVTAVAIHYSEDKPVRKQTAKAVSAGTDHRETQKQSQPDMFYQGELGLTNLSRGIFDKLPVAKYKDTDLDVPTFQRLNLTIDKGS